MEKSIPSFQMKSKKGKAKNAEGEFLAFGFSALRYSSMSMV